MLRKRRWFYRGIDKKAGTFSSLETGGHNLLKKDGGPMLHLWRAPHRKDDMWAYEDWINMA